MQQTETRIQMIKMVNEFKLTVVHFARPNPMQICGCAWIYRWTKRLRKIRTGHRAAGRSRAVGRGPLGRRPAFSKTLALSLGLIFPRGQSVSGHVVHAKMFPARSPRIRHRNELTERDWENAVRGLGNQNPLNPSSTRILQIYGC